MGGGRGKNIYKIDTCCYSTTMSGGYYKTSKKLSPKKLDRLQYLGRSKVARYLLVK